MRRTRKMAKSLVESSDSEDNIPIKKLQISFNNRPIITDEKKGDSSSESDIENYLQPVDKIDLNSSFFKTRSKDDQELEKIESNFFAGITRLSDSESDAEETNENTKLELKHIQEEVNPGTSGSGSTKLNFQQLEEYTKQMELAKKHVEEYNARKSASEKIGSNIDISNLLAVGESKQITYGNIKSEDLHSSDFESCDSEKEDWEEVKHKDSQEKKETRGIPKEGLQIIVDMPDTCRKKKGVDLLAAMKRRLNRIRKENQIYVHKVHLLCWIAHGNYVNAAINNPQTLGLALSLLPLDKCYPSDRTDLNYLEQIVQWYRETIKLVEKPTLKKSDLVDFLKFQISKKEAFNKNILVYIFIAILRALGIQCRLVLSFQVEPLRPPSKELHSLRKETIKKESNNSLKNATKGRVKDKSFIGKKSSQSKKKEKQNNISSKTANPVINEDKPNKEKKLDGSRASRSRTAKEKKEESSNVSKTNVKNNVNSKEEQDINKFKSNSKLNNPKENSKGYESKNKKSNDKTRDDSEESKLYYTRRNAVAEKTESKNANTKTNVKNKKNYLKMEESEQHSRGEPSNKEKKDKRYDTRGNETKSKNANTKISVKNLKMKESEHHSRSEPSNEEKKAKRYDTRGNETKSKNANTKTSVTNKKSNLKIKESEQHSKGEPSNKEKKESKTSKKEVIKIKFSRNKNLKAVPQLDGVNSSSEEDTIYEFIIPQLDGADDKKNKPASKKSNLKKLKTREEICKVKNHPSRLKSRDNDYNSDDDFRPRSPFTKKNTNSPKWLENCKVNLHKLKDACEKPKVQSRQLNIKNDIINLIKGRSTEQKHLDRSRKVKKRKQPYNDSDSDSDFMPEPVKKKHHDSDSDIDYFVPKSKVKKRIRIKKTESGMKIISSDRDHENSGKKNGYNVWAEVFLESEKKWVSVDVVCCQVHCVKELYTRATHPISYIVAWDNNNNVKDITKRYCTNFNTITRKLRIDSKWWDETLKPFSGKYTARDKEEDDDLNRQQLDQPMPKSIAEYKNHPLYALRRHLLKYEEIYPPDIQPLGFVRGEAVYPRNCVYVCHSREIWHKEAKVVKPGEKPYKLVKANPKYDKLSNKVLPSNGTLEIFGEWQTSDYEPPTAKNGVVPRNAYGNVELFKLCMLPKGTVHLKLPGLNKVCRRMNIDCASAIVGFDCHGGWSHPLYDGFVVCEEFADSVVAAWELEQDEIEKKETEKIEKRVYGNWKKLIKGLLIRERLKAKYDFGEPSNSGDSKEKKPKGPRFCTKKR